MFLQACRLSQILNYGNRSHVGTGSQLLTDVSSDGNFGGIPAMYNSILRAKCLQHMGTGDGALVVWFIFFEDSWEQQDWWGLMEGLWQWGALCSKEGLLEGFSHRSGPRIRGWREDQAKEECESGAQICQGLHSGFALGIKRMAFWNSGCLWNCPVFFTEILPCTSVLPTPSIWWGDNQGQETWTNGSSSCVIAFWIITRPSEREGVGWAIIPSL